MSAPFRVSLRLLGPICAAACSVLPCAAVDVGSGTPTTTIQQQFISAYYRNGFNLLVALPPLGDVRKSGSAGLAQEFSDVANTGARLALVRPDQTTSSTPVFQVWASIYSYYQEVGTGNAGYPTMDTANCPIADSAIACTFQFFDLGYALFSYASGLNVSIAGPFYLKWVGLGGLNGPGRPLDAESVTSSRKGTSATVQLYANGAIFSITSGGQNGKVYGVSQPIYGLFQTLGGGGGLIGFPTSDELTLAGGVRRQTFEGGAIEYIPGSDPQLRLSVGSISITGVGSTVRLKLGETAPLKAVIYADNGAEITGRPVSWTTSNGRVATVEASGATATLKAVGGGSAVIVAAAEGKTSNPVPVFVTAPCCQIGEGAPNTAVQQAFEDAVARNRLAVQLPAANPAQRLGTGYVQALQAAGAPGTRYLIAKSDRAGSAYVVSGDFLTRYEQMGGPAGSLGYPASDSTAGGRQMFESNAALAAQPLRVVSGAVLVKWAALGYETGAAGPPTAEAEPFSTIGANSGAFQPFRGGAIYGAGKGPRAGEAYFVSGSILEKYITLGGPAGTFGMPASDEAPSGAARLQRFEGGSVEYLPGQPGAKETPAERRPQIMAVPASVVAGNRVLVAVSGFPPGSTLRVSQTGQEDFQVTAPNGAFAWETYIPPSAKAGMVSIRASDSPPTGSAEGGYSVRGFADNRVRLTKVAGDMQSGPPGATLPEPLRVALRDQAGNPIAGARVVFAGSPGAQVLAASAVTDENGTAEFQLRLPQTEGVALATVDSPSIAAAPVTFSARAASSSLANFPRFAQAEGGPLVAGAAAILRHQQNRGVLPMPNGPAEPALLGQYLKGLCSGDLCDGYLSQSGSGEQVANLWRVGEFAGGAVEVSVERPELAVIRDLVAGGDPVLLGLTLTSDGAATGGHFVVAIGVGADGGILIQDPRTEFARNALSEYLNGVSQGSRVWKAELLSALRLVARPPAARRFLLAAVSQQVDTLRQSVMEVVSTAGPCGRSVDLPDLAPGRISRFVACDGDQPAYQANLTGTVTVTDFIGAARMELSPSPRTSYELTRPAQKLVSAPQGARILPAGIVNAATFTAGIAPGGLMSIFGSGLSSRASETRVEVGGASARVVSASPFQINAQAPSEVVPGTYPVRVTSSFGTVEQPVEIRAVAPAVFLLGGAGRGAVVNHDGSINSPLTPGQRGQPMTIYCTGLGKVTQQGSIFHTVEPVTVMVGGMELPASFAGLTPGFSGLYQVNVLVPTSLPPGIDLSLILRQSGQSSGSLSVSIH